MVSRLLNLCGLELGPENEIMPPAEDNPAGFWENTRFVELNDRLLNEFGGGWDCPPDEQVDWSDGRLAFFRTDARTLAARFDGARAWGWKDPRNSLLLPFWREIIPDLKTVVLLRNPLDVAASLQRRNGTTYALSLTLWRRYNERIIAATEPACRIVTRYDAYLEDPAGELRRLLDFVELEVPQDAFEQACASISPAARHHAATDRLLAQSNVNLSVLELYAQLCAEAAERQPARSRALVAVEPGVVSTTVERPRRNGHKPGGLGTARLVPLGHLEQLDGQPTGLGRELVRIRGHFADNAASLERISAAVAELAALPSEIARDVEARQRAALAGLDQRLAQIEARQSEVLAGLDQRLVALERLASDGQRAQQAKVEELSQFSRYLAHRLDQPPQDSERGRSLAKLAAAVQALTAPGRGVILMGWEGQDLSRMIVGRSVHYIPQSPAGDYVQAQPTTSESLLAQLESHRANGAEYAVCPQEMLWWRESFTEFWAYLERRYPVVWEEDSSGLMFALGDQKIRPRRAWEADVEAVVREFRARYDRDPAILDWTGGRLAPAFPELATFQPPDSAETLPYLPRSIDVVAVSEEHDSPQVSAVAAHAVITLSSDADGCLAAGVRWVDRSRRARVTPSASVVIPSWNGIDHTEKCVIALSETLPHDYDCEIVVVDDASTDDTPERLAILARHEPRLKVLRNEQNSGFIMTCNRGAAESYGDYVIMLNNDTVPLPGWLEPLLAVFRHYPDAGAATGKLLFPDGVMQEAGGVIFSDSRAANFGKWETDTQHPLFNYVREVDYGSGALLAAPRALWSEIGGFDTLYRPIYCDDSDFCFKVRQRGLKVYYQPECAIVHVEGATNGRDESKGDKRYQAINREKMAKRWRREIRRQPPYPDGFGHDTLHDIVVREEYTSKREVKR